VDATVEIVAEVFEDLHIEGRIRAKGPFHDPLELLPSPISDDERVRLFPLGQDPGEMTWEEQPDGSITFQTRLPHRRDQVGVTDLGIMANGGWYPLPEQFVGHWDVRLKVPEGMLGVLGGEIGRELHWTGAADRASIAVIPDGQVFELPCGTVVAKRLRKRVEANLCRAVSEAGVVVEAPLRSRLSEGGVGMAYLSDQAWQLPPFMTDAHDGGATEGIYAASFPHADGWDRELFAATARLLRYESGLKRITELAEIVWRPPTTLRGDRASQFRDDLLHRVHRDHSLDGDPQRRFRNWTPPGHVAAQLADDGADLEAVVNAGKAGSLPEFAVATRIPIAKWRRPYPEQDYKVFISGGVVLVERIAEDDVPEELVTIANGDESDQWFAPSGNSEAVVADDRGRVILDPERHLDQPRKGDRKPPRVRVGVGGNISQLRFNPFLVQGFVTAVFRGAEDNQNAVALVVATSDEDLVSGSVNWLHYMGQATTMARRAHRFSIAPRISWLNPSFSPLDDARYAVEVYVAYNFDNRTSRYNPLKGTSARIYSRFGIAPETLQSWLNTEGVLTGVTTPVTPVTFAGQLRMGGARTTLSHRLLSLGGTNAVRALPGGDQLSTWRGVARGELRVSPFMNGGWDLGVVWLSQIQLVAGLDMGVLLEPNRAALGASAGVNVVANILGVRPQLVGLQVAWPLWWTGFEVENPRVPQFTVNFEQAF